MRPVRVPVEQPLLLGASLKSGQAFRWSRMPGAGEEGFVGVAEGHAWSLRRAQGALLVQAEPALTAGEAEAWARRYFRLGDDYIAMMARLQRDAALRTALAPWEGLRVLRTEPWECLLGFLTSIHDSVPAIETRISRLCRHFGEPLRTTLPGFPRGWAWATPSPQRLARAHEARLRSAAGLGFRARYVRAAAGMVARGDLPLAELARMPYDEAHEVLLRVPGVGDKVADCVQLYGLGQLESFPVDRWIHRVMARDFVAGQRAKPRDMVAHARRRWGADTGYAQQFLFHHARVGSRGAPPPGGSMPVGPRQAPTGP